MSRIAASLPLSLLILLQVSSLARTAAPPVPLIDDRAKSATAPAPVATWPQWRGPARDGRAPGIAFPDSLKEDRLQPLWRVELAEGYSSPVVAEDRVFVVETRDKEKEVVRALDRATGKQLWSTDWAGAMKVAFFAAGNGSWVRSTPAYDGQHLFVAGMRDVLVCLDARDGTVVWRVDFVERYKTPLPAFGFVSSPLVVGPHLYTQAGASFVKLDKATGKEVWRTLIDEGGIWGNAFSSPMLARIRGVEQLVVQTRTDLAGVDVASGRVLWTTPVKAFRGMNILNPTIVGDRVFTWSYGGGSFAFDIKREDGKWSVSPAWEDKIEGYMSTPVVVDGHAYLFRRDGRFSCIDLENGKDVWTSKNRYGEYWSLATDGKRILALDQKGILYLVRATPEKPDLIDSRQIAEAQTWAHVAVCGDQVFVRELKAIAVHRWR